MFQPQTRKQHTLDAQLTQEDGDSLSKRQKKILFREAGGKPIAQPQAASPNSNRTIKRNAIAQDQFMAELVADNQEATAIASATARGVVYSADPKGRIPLEA